MIKFYCLMITIFSYNFCSGQNLVPNSSFEDTIVCPFSASEVNASVAWHASRESPDYFNTCNNYSVGIPNNLAGFQYAADGEAYVGFIPYSRVSANIREQFTCQLLSPVLAGTKYFVSFFLSHSNNYSGLSCNKIGLLFSNINYDLTNPSPINNACQFYTDSIIQDTLNWVLISGSFISDSNYSYLSIGGFFSDSLTDTLYIPPASHSYYLIDKICVSTDSLTCNSLVGFNETHNPNDLIIFPNPFFDNLKITTKIAENLEFRIYDVTSRIIFENSFTNSLVINTDRFNSGLYFYEVKNKNKVIKSGKLVKNNP